MASRTWTVKFTSPKCDACGAEGPPGEDGSAVYLRNVADRDGWWLRHSDGGDLFMICADCRPRIGNLATAQRKGTTP